MTMSEVFSDELDHHLKKMAGQFFCHARSVGIKRSKKEDLALLFMPGCQAAAGLFTKNVFRAPSVEISEAHLKKAIPKAILVNSGCANACMGKKGIEDAYAMIHQVAAALKLSKEEVLLAQTGVIGTKMPMQKVVSGIDALADDMKKKYCSLMDFAKGILTTDSHAKIASSDVGKEGVILGVTKGSGMIAPNMATSLTFLVTNVHLGSPELKQALRNVIDKTYNRASVDTDTSTNDMVLLLSSGELKLEDDTCFDKALYDVCFDLMKQFLLDAEGAKKMLLASIKGAPSQELADRMAKAMIDSPLIKTMVAGESPNWGRIVMVVGKIAGESDIELDNQSLSAWINETCIFKHGKGLLTAQDTLDFSSDTTTLEIDLAAGSFESRAYGCDMHERYVSINKDKT